MLVKYLWKAAQFISIVAMGISLAIIFFCTEWWAIALWLGAMLAGYLVQRFAPTYLW